MVFSAGIILVVGGLCACAPLFKRISQGLGRALSVLGFLVGILVLIVSIDYALGLGFLSSAISDAVAWKLNTRCLESGLQSIRFRRTSPLLHLQSDT